VGKIVCSYYMTESGRLPVKEFIKSLDFATRKKYFYVMGLLEEFGHTLPYPHAKYLGNSIFELRFMGSEGAIRVLYFFFVQDKAVLTNGLIKKTNKTPKREIVTALERRKRYLAINRRNNI
jgi:phage-related protein